MYIEKKIAIKLQSSWTATSQAGLGNIWTSFEFPAHRFSLSVSRSSKRQQKKDPIHHTSLYIVPCNVFKEKMRPRAKGAKIIFAPSWPILAHSWTGWKWLKYLKNFTRRGQTAISHSYRHRPTSGKPEFALPSLHAAPLLQWRSAGKR